MELVLLSPAYTELIREHPWYSGEHRSVYILGKPVPCQCSVYFNKNYDRTVTADKKESL